MSFWQTENKFSVSFLIDEEIVSESQLEKLKDESEIS
jgi:hypothetical protein